MIRRIIFAFVIAGAIVATQRFARSSRGVGMRRE